MSDSSHTGGHYAAALGPAQDAPAPTESNTPPAPQRIIEAMLFAGGQPLTAESAAGVIRGLTQDEFQRTLEGLGRDYRRQNRPYALQATAQGYVLKLKPRFQGLAERLAGAPREARLSRAAVEVLSLIAFQQPVTRSAIDSQRGHDSAALVRQLVRLGLVTAAEAEREPTYATTPRFLELFGLRSLDDLPRTDDLQLL